MEISDLGPPYEDMSDQAKAVWLARSDEFGRQLRRWQRPAFKIYCELEAELDFAREMVARNKGPFMELPNGYVGLSPWAQEVNRLRGVILRMLDRGGFGLANDEDFIDDSGSPLD